MGIAFYKPLILEKKMLKGTHHSEATKQKMRQNSGRRGKSSWLKGKHPIPWNKGKKGLYSEEYKQKLRAAGKSHPVPWAGNPPWNKGKAGCFSEEVKKRQREERLGEKNPFYGKHHTDEYKQKKRENWLNKDFAMKVLSGNIPSGPELYPDFLLQNHFPDEWEFTGDGKVILHGLCPDFVNCNGKKRIIELFSYWHTRKETPYNRTEGGRKKVFAELGYSTLVIWDYELKDENKVIEKIREWKT